MGIYLETVDHNEVFNNLSEPPIIINDLDILSDAGKQKLNSLIVTEYDEESLPNIPVCDCGHTEGGWVNHLCPICQTPVRLVTERDIESKLWIRPPDGVKTLISPVAWFMLSRSFTNQRVNIIEYLTNPTYKPVGFSPNLEKIKSYGFKRSLNYFYTNFDFIIESLFAAKVCNGAKAIDKRDVYDWIQQNRANIFCKYLPIVNRIAFVTEFGANSKTSSGNVVSALDAIRTITSLANTPNPSLKLKESRTVKTISQLSAYYGVMYQKNLGAKPGTIRKHCFGGRLHFTFRGVITSITARHQYDELHLPWCIAVNILKPHIKNVLLKQGYTPSECAVLTTKAANSYLPEIDRIFTQLLAEGPDGSLPVIFQRNPSLARGSAQLLRVTKIKTEISDRTIGVSVLIITAPNNSISTSVTIGLFPSLVIANGIPFELPEQTHNSITTTPPRKRLAKADSGYSKKVILEKTVGYIPSLAAKPLRTVVRQAMGNVQRLFH